MKILLLCTGNSCRSQMAEGILKSIDPNIEVYSAGVNPAKDINRRTIQVMREIGIDISLGFTKNSESFLNEDFDFVITLCKNARMNPPDFKGNIKNEIYIEFEDPWNANGSNDDIMIVFRKVRDKIRQEFFKFYIDHIKANSK